jgi:uncharacterized protein YxjI
MRTLNATETSLFFPEFFSGNDYFIDEKITFFKFRNEYKVYDASGGSIGGVVQKISFSHKLLQVFFKKAVLPFNFYIVDNNKRPLLVIRRGWTFWLSRILIEDENNIPLGYIKQKFKLVNPSFWIYSSDRKLVAEINGDWKAWNFSIINREHIKVGEINKKWNGFLREIFTTSDKYHVAVNSETISPVDKRLIVATAITIDRVLKESN